MAAEPSEKDEMQEYLSSLNLQQLDLDSIDLEDGGPSPWWRWARGAALLAVGVALVWLPTTNYYQLNANSSWLFGGLCIAALLLGGGAARFLWSWMQTVALRNARSALERASLPTFRIPPALLRWGTLLTALTLGGVMLFGMPHEADWQGSGYSSLWFIAVGMALLAGLLLGRWIIMQASANPIDPASYRPWVLPPWFKWANLGMLIAGGLFAAFGHHLMADPEAATFSLGGVGFGVGVLGAIWIARRFDEVEADLRARHRPPEP